MPGLVTAVLKLSERCNLDCSYCYMYQGADQGWRERPAFTSEEDRMDPIRRLLQHADTFPDVSLILAIHGGEPSLRRKRGIL